MGSTWPTAKSVMFTKKKHGYLQVIVMNRITRNVKKARRPLNIAQININGLSNHSQIALERFIEVHEISLMALQEVKITKDKISSVTLSGGMQKFLSPKTDKTSGVGLLIHSNLRPQRMQNLEEPDLDIVWCMVKLGSFNTLIASVYCPPLNEDVTTLKKILANMNLALNYGKNNGIENMLVLGDFNSRNINWCDTKTNQRGRVLLKHINDSNYTIFTPVEKTYVCVNGGGSVIDLMIGHGEIADQVEVSWLEKTVELYSGAPQRGHYPVIYTLTAQSHKGEKKSVNDYSSTDWDMWKDYLDRELAIHSHLIENDVIIGEEKLVDIVCRNPR